MILTLFFTIAIPKAFAQNINDINQKINELKALEKVIDEKTAQLKTESINIANQKKQLEQSQNALKTQLKTLNTQIEQAKKELENLQTNIVSQKIQKLSTIYAQAKPSAAAEELSNMDPQTAAQILTYMQPRQSGAIISKMDPKTAANIFTLYLKSKHQ